MALTTDVSGPGIVLSLVLAETAVGGIAVLWLSPIWGRVRLGFFKLVGTVLTACAIGAWLAARAPLAGAPQELGLAGFACFAVAWQALVWGGALRVSRAIGITAVATGAVALVWLGYHPAAEHYGVSASFQLFAGALFAGAATDGLLLGHWYLVDRKLPPDPLARVNTLFLAGCAVAIVAAALGLGGGGSTSAQFSPLLGAGALAGWLAVGLIALCALIGGFIHALVRERSMQAATGLFYLGVILALAAEFAAKVRFY